MTWGNPKAAGSRGAWSDSRMRAAGAACAAQLPVAGIVAFTLTLGDDDYGATGGGAIGLVCFLLFGPFLLPVVGLLHAAVLTLPAAWLGRLGAARLGRGPEWAWPLACLLPVGAAWAACFAALGAPFVQTALWSAASGVLPVLHVAYCRRREERLGRPLRKVWTLSGLTSLGLCVAVLGGAVAATATGLIKEYEPPRLSVEQLTGTWRGEDDESVVLRLRADGRAVLDGTPFERVGTDAGGWYDSELARCHATGTWRVDRDRDRFPRRPAVAVDAKGCGDRQLWTVGGTEARPELFVSFGDPDSPDIEVLVRRRG
ncbi:MULTISPECIES: hypothetical protein [Streptomyces]|uniref:hypothetical protein n=1 Tax=Streptomyces TaxID=1883 RepID=UPI001E396BAF|nr:MULTISPECIES: hypothetical protein [Streptomyces]UFQ16310.1 hypothetical protein J2N69_15620 [Streptomyces huasconensis]WCL85914.1 hypothetical protein PPN52_15630 [Streptomyces sp. JCM 35825]